MPSGRQENNPPTNILLRRLFLPLLFPRGHRSVTSAGGRMACGVSVCVDWTITPRRLHGSASLFKHTSLYEKMILVSMICALSAKGACRTLYTLDPFSNRNQRIRRVQKLRDVSTSFQRMGRRPKAGDVM